MQNNIGLKHKETGCLAYGKLGRLRALIPMRFCFYTPRPVPLPHPPSPRLRRTRGERGRLWQILSLKLKASELWILEKSLFITVLLIMTVLSLSACTPVVVGGATTAAVAASQERGIGGTISDTELKAKINNAWFQNDLDMHRRLNTTIYQGRVLLTGAARDEGQQLNAVRLAWQTKGVRDVYNEIVVDDARTLLDYADDGWIETRINAALTFDVNIKSQNIKVDVVGGTVYLIGVAQNQRELDAVINHARTTPRVSKVVHYIETLS